MPRKSVPNLQLLAFIQAGQLLYGPRWQSAVARDLGLPVTTVARWVRRQHKFDQDVLPMLHATLTTRQSVIAEWLIANA